MRRDRPRPRPARGRNTACRSANPWRCNSPPLLSPPASTDHSRPGRIPADTNARRARHPNGTPPCPRLRRRTTAREQMGRCEKRPYHVRCAHLTGRDAFHRVVRTGFTPSLINPRTIPPTSDVISGSQERRRLPQTSRPFHRTPPGNKWDAVKSVLTSRDVRTSALGTRPTASVIKPRVVPPTKAVVLGSRECHEPHPGSRSVVSHQSIRRENYFTHRQNSLGGGTSMFP